MSSHVDRVVFPGQAILGSVLLAMLLFFTLPTLATAARDGDPIPPVRAWELPEKSHIVEDGDTLLGIAGQFGVDIDELAAANALANPHALSVGQRLVIPARRTENVVSARSQVLSARSGQRSLMIVPAAGPISTYFGEQGPYWKRGWHPGIDYAAPYGSPVHAALGGVVVESADGYNGGYGIYVKIDHGNGLQTLYAHLSRRFVEEGEVVSQGDRIGLVGSTGVSTGPHLHFEVHVNGEVRDPAKYLP